MTEENETKEETKQEESLVAKAERLNSENRQVLEDLRKEREKIERLKSEKILSGESLGGVPEEKPKVETPKEYANRVLSGQFNKK